MSEPSSSSTDDAHPRGTVETTATGGLVDGTQNHLLDVASLDEVVTPPIHDIPSPKLQPYDPGPVRDKVRGRVIGGLIALLATVTILPLFAILYQGFNFEGLRDFLALIYGSIVTMVGTALGFYFGEKI